MSPAPRAVPLVAREQSLQALWGEVAASATAGMRAAVVRGPAGSGKTRLLEAFAERARSAGATVLPGRAPALGGHPYAALADALAGYVRSSAPAGGQVRRAGAALASLVPALASPEAVPAGPPETLAVVQAAYRLVREVTLRRPLVLLLDDAHLADSDTCEVLSALSRHGADLPWTVVFGWRDPSEEVRPHALRLLEQLRRERDCLDLDLEPLRPAATAELVAALLGDGLPAPSLVSMLQGRTAGNPYYVEEMVRWLRDSGRLRRAGLQWLAVPGSEADLPPSLEETLRHRTRSLDAGARTVLQWLAVAGGSLDLALLTEVSGLEAATLADALDRLVSVGLVAEERARRTGYRVRHPLVAECVERDLTAAHRRLVHRRLATVLAARGEPPGVVAAHHVRAADPGDEAAIAAAVAAAADAEQRTNLTQAVSWYEAVLALCDRPDHPRRLCALDRVSELGGLAGRSQLARAAVEELLGRTPASDHLRRATLLRRLAAIRIAEGDPRGAHRAIEEGLALCAGAGPEAAMLLAELAMVAEMTMSIGDLAAVVARGREAALASGARGAAVVLRAFEALGTSEAGEPRAGFDIALAGAREAVAVQDPLAFGYNTFAAGIASFLLGRFSWTERSLENFVGLAEEAGLVWGSAWMWVLIGEARLYLGRNQASLGAFLRAEELGQRPGAAVVMPLPSVVLAEALVSLGRLSEAADRLEEARKWLHERPNELARAWYLHALGQLRLAEDRPHEAAAALEEMAAICRARGRFAQLALVPSLVHALVAARRHGDALAVATSVAEVLAGRDIPLCGAAATRALAAALAATGDVDGALAEAERALALAEKLDGDLFCALALSTLGDVRLAAGDRSGAREVLGRAHAALLALGVEPERRRVAARLASLGVAPPPPRSVAVTSSSDGGPLAALTPREREVAELAATGMSSRAIALRLGVSERTVENHLQRAYDKLGLHRRAQLVALLVERDRRRPTS